MSRLISDFPPREERGCPPWSACRTCGRQRVCPYACGCVWEEDHLRRAVWQGESAARRMTAEAGRLLSEISAASHVRQLLRADAATERTLLDALRAEVSLTTALPPGKR